MTPPGDGARIRPIPPPAPQRVGVSTRRRPLDDSSRWPLRDRIGLALCWAAGLLLCAVAASITLYLGFQGLRYLSFELLTTRPTGQQGAEASGGVLDPIVGTVLLTTLGIAIAGPLGVAVALWLTEYGRPRRLARIVESAVEMIAGTPSIVLAIFGLIVFTSALGPLSFGFLSDTAEGGAIFGRSFLTAAAMMSLIALPIVVGTTREALNAIPGHVREASYALGKTRAATIRRVLLPAIRPGIATGSALGMGRIAGDTAIVLILLGGTAQLTAGNGPPGVDTLRGTGSTLTSFVYEYSPAGEGNAPEKAYAAAFVLLLVVVALNFAVDLVARGRREAPSWTR